MTTTTKDWGFPETRSNNAACMVDKSRKVGDQFEGCCAVYFMGKRVGYGKAVAPSRRRALTAAAVVAGYKQIEDALTLRSLIGEH